MSRDTYLKSGGKRVRGTAPQAGEPPPCPTTGKVSYASRAKAKKHIGGAVSKRVYDCPFCPYWHRTKAQR